MSVFMLLCSLFGIKFPAKESKDMIEMSEQSFVVSLEENGTTGYLWNYKIADENIVKFENDDFIVPAQTGMTGAPGTRVFTFKAAAPGKTTIELSYARSWEASAIKTVTVAVEVTGDMTVTAQIVQ